jgi:hypothetical protein
MTKAVNEFFLLTIVISISLADLEIAVYLVFVFLLQRSV